MGSQEEAVTFKIPDNVSYAPSGCIEGLVAVEWPSKQASFEARTICIKLVRKDTLNTRRSKSDSSRELSYASQNSPSIEKNNSSPTKRQQETNTTLIQFRKNHPTQNNFQKRAVKLSCNIFYRANPKFQKCLIQKIE